MAETRYVSNSAGLEELARGQLAQNLVRAAAEGVSSRAGDGFVARYAQGKSRFGAIVIPETFSAMARERRDNVLVRSLG